MVSYDVSLGVTLVVSDDTNNVIDIMISDDNSTSSSSEGHPGNEGRAGPGALVIFLLVLYSLIYLFGTSGNCLVIYVVTRYAKMRSVTNTYIVNLALADCSFLVGLPMLIITVVKQGWIFGRAVCKLYMILYSVNWFTSVFTLTVLSIDRYLAVCHAVASLRYRTQPVARIVSAGVWIASLLAMTPVILYTEAVDDGGTISCTVQLPQWGEEEDGGWDVQAAFIWYVFALAFVVPVGLISVFYSLVIIRLRRSGPSKQTANRKRSTRKVTQMVLAVIAVYVLCWAPYYIHQTTVLYVEEPPVWTSLLFQFFTVLTYSNSALNPLLYAFLSDNFRKSFLATFHCQTGKGLRTEGVTGGEGRRDTAGEDTLVPGLTRVATKSTVAVDENVTGADEKEKLRRNLRKAGFENGLGVSLELAEGAGYENGARVGFENGAKVGLKNGVGAESGKGCGVELQESRGQSSVAFVSCPGVTPLKCQENKENLGCADSSCSGVVTDSYDDRVSTL